MSGYVDKNADRCQRTATQNTALDANRDKACFEGVERRHGGIMNPTQRLARLVTWLFWALILGTIAFVAHAWVAGGFPFYTRVDPRTGTAGLAVETDAGTGCQYILTPLGGIVPRTGPDGRPKCGKP